MKCIILAAGYATRLYPLTENFPKPLLKVGEKTILDWLIDDIDESGIVDEYVVVSNHKFIKHFQNWAKDLNKSIKIIDDGTINNENRLGAVKDIKLAIDNIEVSHEKENEVKDGYLIIAGDNLLDFSLQRFIYYTKIKNASCIMRFYEENKERLKKCGIVEVDKDDRIISMEEKPENPKSHWVSPPFYYFTEDDVLKVGNAITEGCGVDAPGSFISWLSSKTNVYAMPMPGRRYDIGNLESYDKVKKEYKGIEQT